MRLAAIIRFQISVIFPPNRTLSIAHPVPIPAFDGHSEAATKRLCVVRSLVPITKSTIERKIVVIRFEITAIVAKSTINVEVLLVFVTKAFAHATKTFRSKAAPSVINIVVAYAPPTKFRWPTIDAHPN